MRAILYEDGYNNAVSIKNTPYIERQKRAGFAYILASNPETFDIMIKNNIDLFHGTSNNALPNILKYGMQSVDEQAQNNIPTVSGEEWSRRQGKRSFISFTDDIGTAFNYALMNQQGNKSNFGVLIGMLSKSLKQLKKCRIGSDLPEIGIKDNIPIEEIKFIAVPPDKVEFVKKLVGDRHIIVSSIDINKIFYDINIDFGDIKFDVEKAKELKEKRKDIHEGFDSEDLSNISKTRKLSGIRKIYEMFKKIINKKGRDYEENSRDK